MEYRIVSHKAEKLLENRVNQLILEGWKPQGGVFIGVYTNSVFIYQAMVKGISE